MNTIPIDILLFCPNCGEQHVDEAKPDVCEACGGVKDDFPKTEGMLICLCSTFTAWLNPPHKSHCCVACNHVWRPADVPTNGALTLKTSGSRDGNPRPRYFYTARDYEDAVAAARAEAFTEAAQACEFTYFTADNGHQVMADYPTQQACIATIRALASQAEEKR